MGCKSHTYEVIYEIQNWMVKNIQISIFIEGSETHLQKNKSASAKVRNEPYDLQSRSRIGGQTSLPLRILPRSNRNK